ncbi:hypothetical protein [Streptosporangium canum]|uniref:hypothetical protein n=1 Tax=Streptosporangium canum TaxID=324952 RepID=UPI0015A6EF49|nr:hypothetical protein [Streptosporangium canum]
MNHVPPSNKGVLGADAHAGHANTSMSGDGGDDAEHGVEHGWGKVADAFREPRPVEDH